VLTIFLLALPMTCDIPQISDDAAPDEPALQGQWEIRRVAQQGAVLGDLQPLSRLEFKGNHLLGGTKATFTLNPMAQVKQIDLILVEGPNKGRTCKGIYSLENGVLYLCISIGDKGQRPKSFTFEFGIQDHTACTQSFELRRITPHRSNELQPQYSPRLPYDVCFVGKTPVSPESDLIFERSCRWMTSAGSDVRRQSTAMTPHAHQPAEEGAPVNGAEPRGRQDHQSARWRGVYVCHRR